MPEETQQLTPPELTEDERLILDRHRGGDFSKWLSDPIPREDEATNPDGPWPRATAVRANMAAALSAATDNIFARSRQAARFASVYERVRTDYEKQIEEAGRSFVSTSPRGLPSFDFSKEYERQKLGWMEQTGLVELSKIFEPVENQLGQNINDVKEGLIEAGILDPFDITPELMGHLKEVVAHENNEFRAKTHWDSAAKKAVITGKASNLDIADMNAQIHTGIISQVLMELAPIKSEDYAQSSFLALRNIAWKEYQGSLARGNALLESGTLSAGEKTKILEEQEAWRILSAIDVDAAAEVRQYAGLMFRQGNLNPAERIKRDRYAVERGMEQKRYAASASRGEGLIRRGTTELSDFSPPAQIAVNKLNDLLGARWSDVMVNAYENVDAAVRLNRLGLTNNGLNLYDGTVLADPLKPDFLSPLDFAEPGGLAKRMAMVFDSTGVMPLPGPTTHRELEQQAAEYVNAPWATREDKLKAQGQVMLNHLELLVRAGMTAATAGEQIPHEARQTQPTFLPDEEAGRSYWRKIDGITKWFSDGWSVSKFAAGQFAESIPLVTAASQRAAGMLLRDPQAGEAFRNPGEAFNILPRVLMGLYDTNVARHITGGMTPEEIKEYEDARSRTDVAGGINKWLDWQQTTKSDLDTYSKIFDPKASVRPGEWTLSAMRLLGRGAVAFLGGTLDFFANDPTEAVVLSEVLKPLAGGYKALKADIAASHFFTIRRMRNLMPKLLKADPTIGKAFSSSLKRVATETPEALLGERLGHLAAVLDGHVAAIEAGKHVSPRMFKFAAQEISDLLPNLTKLDSPVGHVFKSFTDPLVAKTLKAPGPARRLIANIRGKNLPPIRPREGTALNFYFRQLAAEYEREVIARIAQDAPSVQRLATLNQLISGAELGTKPVGAKAYQAAMAERAAILEQHMAGATKDLGLDSVDFDSLKAIAGRVDPPKRLGEFLKNAGLSPREVQGALGDYNILLDWEVKNAAKYAELATQGAIVEARHNTIYATLRRWGKAEVEKANQKYKAAEELMGTLADAGLKDEALVQAGRMSEAAAERARVSRWMTRLEEEILSQSDVPYWQTRSLGKKSIVWDKESGGLAYNRESPVLLADLIEQRPDLWPEFAGQQLVTKTAEGVSIAPEIARKMRNSLTAKRFTPAEEVKRLPDLRGAAAELGAVTGLSVHQISEPGFWWRYVTAFPYQGRGAMMTQVARNARLARGLSNYRIQVIAEGLETMTAADRRALTELITVRADPAKLEALAEKHPWIARDLLRLRTDIPKTERIQTIARQMRQLDADSLGALYDSGVIDKGQYADLLGRPLREVQIQRLHSRAAKVPERGVQAAVRDMRDSNLPSAAGLHPDQFMVQRNPHDYRLFRRTRAGDTLDERFETLAALEDRVGDLWGEEILKKFRSKGFSPDGTKSIKSAVGDTIGAAEPIDPKRWAELDVAGLELQPEAQLFRIEQAFEDAMRFKVLQTLESIGGYVLKKEDYEKLIRSAAKGKRSGGYSLEDYYIRPSKQGDIGLRLGKYSDYYFSRDAIEALAESDDMWRTIKGALKTSGGLLKRAADTVGKYLDYGTNAARNSFILLNRATWFANATFNVLLSEFSGAKVFNVRTIARNMARLAEFRAAAARGEVNPFMAEMVENIGLSAGMMDVESVPVVGRAWRRLQGLYDKSGLERQLNLINGRIGRATGQRALELRADKLAIEQKLKDLSRNSVGEFLKSVSDELTSYYNRAPTASGEARGVILDGLRRGYNSIDEICRMFAYMNLRFDKGLSPKAAAWRVRTFFQDYANVPSKIRALSHKPIFGSLVTSFPWEAGRLTRNILKYQPIKALGMLSMIPAFNMMQLARANVNPSKFFEQLMLERGSMLSAVSDFVTNPILMDHENGTFLGSHDLTNTAAPQADMFVPTGAIGLTYNMMSPRDKRGPIGEMLGPPLGVLSKFVGSTPYLTMAQQLFAPGDQRPLVNWKRASPTDIAYGVLKGLASNVLHPELPHVGRNWLNFREAINAGERTDVGGPYKARAAEDEWMRQWFNIPLRGKTYIGDVIREHLEKKYGKALVEPSAMYSDEKAVRRAAFLFSSDSYGRPEAEFSIDAEIDRLAHRWHFEPDAKKKKELHKELIGKLRTIPPDVRTDKWPEQLRGMTEQEIETFLNNIVGGSVYDHWDRIPGINNKAAALVWLDLEQGKSLDPRTLDNVVEHTVLSYRASVSQGVGIAERKQQDIEKVVEAFAIIEDHVKERGGSVEVGDGLIRVETAIGAYRTMLEFLQKEFNRLGTVDGMGTSPTQRQWINSRLRLEVDLFRNKKDSAK